MFENNCFAVLLSFWIASVDDLCPRQTHALNTHTHTHTHTAIDGEDELVRNYVDISVAVATPEG